PSAPPPPLPSFPTRRSSDLAGDRRRPRRLLRALPRPHGRAGGRDRGRPQPPRAAPAPQGRHLLFLPPGGGGGGRPQQPPAPGQRDRKSTRLNSSHVKISYAV